MISKHFLAAVLVATIGGVALVPASAGNPVFPGHYADPEAAVFGRQYWIYPTSSVVEKDGTYFDAFSSPDLVTWTKHPRILDTDRVSWAHVDMWAPAMSRKNGRYYFFFAANNIHHDGEPGGIGIAVADQPGGPFHDYLGHPLLNDFHHGAQPIDPAVFTADDGQSYLIYGGWGHCIIAKLKADYTGFEPLPDGELFKEITPPNYTEGPWMFERHGKIYFMWSEGDWTGPGYNIRYAIGDSPLGPFRTMGTIIKPDPSVATGAGHNSVIHIPGRDEWYLVYHRRPPGITDGVVRVVCIDKMQFNPDGSIAPVIMTNAGPAARPLP